jgi:hypothetical protein
MSSHDLGRGTDLLAVCAGVPAGDSGGHRTLFTVAKWDLDQAAWTRSRLGLPGHIEPDARHFTAAKVRPFDVYELEDCNIILDAGWSVIMNGIAGSAVTKFSASVGRIGGGISNTATAYNQTDLQAVTGAANRQWELVSAAPTVGGAPQHTTGLQFAATFPPADGNFAWAEFGVDQGTAGGTGASVATMLNRGLASPGTKTASQTWNVTVTITWS